MHKQRNLQSWLPRSWSKLSRAWYLFMMDTTNGIDWTSEDQAISKRAKQWRDAEMSYTS